ncbi:hypothetical protein ACFPYI_16980 [Halomarina salina]|uniref:Uncharacterized protein n=1 Tax=Halomarina salina TaxID=1872699 RepID=A0ABD5RSB1_9EURY|nr:hypothetical protein [Halomarina salina]
MPETIQPEHDDAPDDELEEESVEDSEAEEEEEKTFDFPTPGGLRGL